jgi:hypothetical protein
MSVEPSSPGSASISSPPEKRTKSGRKSFKNQLTLRFGSKARDPGHEELLMGQKLPLGKAMGILAVMMYGPNLPTQKERHGDRMLIWNSAAPYCLSPESIETVLQWPEEDEIILYMQGLLNTSTICVRNFLYNHARDYGQCDVFGSSSRNKEVQAHLGLTMEQSVMDM